MLIPFKRASKGDQKPTIRINDLAEFDPSIKKIKPDEFVLVTFSSKNGIHYNYSFKASRSNKSSKNADTLYGFDKWDFPIPLPVVGAPIKYNVVYVEVLGKNQNKIIFQNGSEITYNTLDDKDVISGCEPKPRPQPFPQGYLAPFKEEAFVATEDKHEKVNPLDERMERLLIEVQSSLILAGGCHKAKHYDHSFKEVMRNLLSNVDKKTLVRIIENSYVF